MNKTKENIRELEKNLYQALKSAPDFIKVDKIAGSNIEKSFKKFKETAIGRSACGCGVCWGSGIPAIPTP